MNFIKEITWALFLSTITKKQKQSDRAYRQHSDAQTEQYGEGLQF